MAFAALRFVGALAVGLILLMAAQFTLIVTGLFRWTGLLLFALPPILVLAVRYAVAGQAGSFDRAAAAGAAVASAAAFAGISAAAIYVAGIIGALCVFILLFLHVPDRFSVVLPAGMAAAGLATLALVVAGGLVCLAVFIWSGKRKAG